MSKLKFPMLFSIFAATLCFYPSGSADVNLGAGAKFSWDNYNHAVLDYSVAEEITGESGLTSNDYPAPRFGGNLQLVINRRFVAMLNLDFGTYKHTVFPYVAESDTQEAIVYAGQTEKMVLKYLKIGIGVEGKFYFKKTEDKKAVPYVFAGVGKYFSKTKSEEPTLQGQMASAKMMSKLASPFYLQLGFGAEFIVNESFSLGADIIGLRLERAKASAGPQLEHPVGDDPDSELDLALTDNAYYTGDQTITNFYIYTALTFNFTFVRDRSAEPAEPQSSDVWGTGGTQQNNSGWGTTTGADASGGWGTPAATPAPAANTGWGTTPAAATPAPAQPAAPANTGWGTPAATPAPAVQPVQPVQSVQPVQPAPEQDVKKPKRKKKKASASVSVGGGGGTAPPPPAP